MWGRESVPENVNVGDHDPEHVSASGSVNGERARIGALVNEMLGELASERIEHVGGDSCHVVGLDLDYGHGDDHDPCPLIAIDLAFCPALDLEIGCGCDGLVYSFGH